MDFSHVAKPFHQLTKKGEEWQWAEEEQGSFEEFKTPDNVHPEPSPAKPRCAV